MGASSREGKDSCATARDVIQLLNMADKYELFDYTGVARKDML